MYSKLRKLAINNSYKLTATSALNHVTKQIKHWY